MKHEKLKEEKELERSLLADSMELEEEEEEMTLVKLQDATDELAELESEVEEATCRINDL